MKKISILGSTGSIGTQTLDVISKNSESFKVHAVSCEKRIDLLSSQIEKFKPEIAVTADEKDAQSLSAKYPGTEFYYGEAGLIKAAAADCDLVVSALVGISGLIPTYRAVLAGNDIALANKETLVAGGSIIMKAACERATNLIPVDSEHSAIFQCLEGNSRKEVKRLILTASGGPFRGYTLEALQQVTTEQALVHPTFDMGSKITIDSATMMNKGLEIIEAKWLFDIPEAKIDVLVHPQSIVHSMVEYVDGALIAQLGKPDMRVPISYALGYPQRIENEESGLDFFDKAKNLTFERPDEDTFRCMKLARFAIRDENSTYPIVLNAANEVLVQLFLKKKIKFTDIQYTIEHMLEEHSPEHSLDIESVLELDKKIRVDVMKHIMGKTRKG